MLKDFKFFTIVFLILIFLLVAGIFVWKIDTSNTKNQIDVKIDKTVIVEKVKALNKLETAEVLVQRDVQITLDLGNFELFGKPLLENKRTQKVAVTGTVVAGVDFSKINDSQITYDTSKNSIDMNLPSSEVFAVNLNEDKTYTLKDDLTLLFSLYNLSSSNRNELNQELQKQVTKQSKKALLEGACKDGIITKANEEAKNSIKRLFTFTKVESFNISFQIADKCEDTVV
jgi:hypothetical protein